jgi:NADH-quinone oxidoreductase subunit N
MFCFMISVIGLPPFAGFVAKLNLLWVLIQNGGGWWWLVAVIGINTIVSAFYYFRVIKAVYVTASEDAPFSPQPLGLAMSVGSAAMLVILFVGYNPFTKSATRGSRITGVGGVGTESYAPAAAVTTPPTSERGS